MNELLTAYLNGLYTLRRGRLTPADAMNHILDLMAGAQRATTGVRTLMSFIGLGRARKAGTIGSGTAKGDEDA